MLERWDPGLTTETRPVSPQRPPDKALSMVAAARLVSRHRLLFVAVLVPVVLCGIAYAVLATPQYTATSVVLIDTRMRGPMQQQTASSAAIESANVDSQVEVLRSESVIRSVVEALDLTHAPDFAARPGLFMSWLQAVSAGWLDMRSAPPAKDPVARTIALVEKNLVVKRLGQSYVIQIDYKATSADRAAEIGNRIVESYIAGQVDARRTVEAYFNSWIERRAAALSGEATRSEQALADRKLAEATRRVARAYAGTGGEAGTDPSTLQANLDRAAAEMAQSTRDTTELKSLESAAHTSRTLAEAFAQRLAEILPQSSGAVSEVRVISRALPPGEKSEPKTLLIVGAALALGVLAGFGAAALREHMLPGLRAPDAVEAETGLPCLGTLVRVGRTRRARRRKGARGGADVLRQAIDQPSLGFAETMRTLRAALRLSGEAGPAQTIGIVSALRHEGKSVVAANLALLCAATGARTLLMDLDLRHCGLSRTLVPELVPPAGRGADPAAPIDGIGSLAERAHSDPDTGLLVLPATPHPPADAFRELSSERMGRVVEDASQQVDIVILDLPALLPTADALALMPVVDAFVFVVAWGSTEAEQVLACLRKVPGLAERTLGIVLNGADPRSAPTGTRA